MAYDGLPAIVYQSSYIDHDGYSIGVNPAMYFSGTSIDSFASNVEDSTSIYSNDQVEISYEDRKNSFNSNDIYSQNFIERDNSFNSNDDIIIDHLYESDWSSVEVEKIPTPVVRVVMCSEYAPTVCTEILT